MIWLYIVDILSCDNLSGEWNGLATNDFLLRTSCADFLLAILFWLNYLCSISNDSLTSGKDTLVMDKSSDKLALLFNEFLETPLSLLSIFFIILKFKIFSFLTYQL